jgi:hypothetical protein
MGFGLDNCAYCGQEYELKRKAQKFCSVNCRVYGDRWKKRESKTPFKRGLKSNVTDLLNISKEISRYYLNGNSAAEIVVEKIELGHFSLISDSEIKYVEKIWMLFKNTDPDIPTEEEFAERLNSAAKKWADNHKK